jgi:hypothetical protein
MSWPAEVEGLNSVLNWSAKHPSEPGLYLMCYGDVEANANVRLLKVMQHWKHKTLIGFVPGSEGEFDINSLKGHKFARLIFGKEAQNET